MFSKNFCDVLHLPNCYILKVTPYESYDTAIKNEPPMIFVLAAVKNVLNIRK